MEKTVEKIPSNNNFKKHSETKLIGKIIDKKTLGKNAKKKP